MVENCFRTPIPQRVASSREYIFVSSVETTRCRAPWPCLPGQQFVQRWQPWCVPAGWHWPPCLPALVEYLGWLGGFILVGCGSTWSNPIGNGIEWSCVGCLSIVQTNTAQHWWYHFLQCVGFFSSPLPVCQVLIWSFCLAPTQNFMFFHARFNDGNGGLMYLCYGEAALEDFS